MKIRSLLIAYFVTLFSVQVFAQDTTEHIIAGRQNSAEQESKPYVIMISIDGFRADYAEKFQAKNLLRLSAEGVRAEYMKPSYPSLTFPNHYT
ncbi:MAG: alkaline phosphatase family protein, partial [Mucilaginibacter polytrichastri]|nr:alkaline phosphatase family protein [Mucilaginibacter polytrichastri]